MSRRRQASNGTVGIVQGMEVIEIFFQELAKIFPKELIKDLSPSTPITTLGFCEFCDIAAGETGVTAEKKNIRGLVRVF